MNYTVEAKAVDASMLLDLLTIIWAMEYYWKEVDICGPLALGALAASAIAMLISFLVAENK